MSAPLITVTVRQLACAVDFEWTLEGEKFWLVKFYPQDGDHYYLSRSGKELDRTSPFPPPGRTLDYVLSFLKPLDTDGPETSIRLSSRADDDLHSYQTSDYDPRLYLDHPYRQTELFQQGQQEKQQDCEAVAIDLQQAITDKARSKRVAKIRVRKSLANAAVEDTGDDQPATEPEPHDPEGGPIRMVWDLVYRI